MNITQEITRLREEFGKAQTQAQNVEAAITGLETLLGTTSTRKNSGQTGAGTAVILMPHLGKRGISAAGRKRIAAAQKARWAKARQKVA
jgi:hypothetical protein